MTDQEWLDGLVAANYAGLRTTAVLTGDGRYVCVYRLIYHFTMIIGCVGDGFGYDDRYCFVNEAVARTALIEWQARGFQSEPMFWRRHPDSGRRRNDAGDPSSEWIAP